MANLAGRTYEVFTADGDRWIYESTHPVRSAALEHAEELLAASGSHDGVRVVAENETTGEQEILFEEKLDRAKVVQLVAISDAPVCEDIIDFYAFPARRTAGKLLRHLLDDQGMTALELAFDPGQLMMLERNDKLHGPAMQRVGAIQAKAAGGKPAERVDQIDRAFTEIMARAKAAPDADKYAALLRSKGLDALIEGARQWEKKKLDQECAILGALAGKIAGSGSWDGKLLMLIDLSGQNLNPKSIRYLDEITAEILDGAEAVKEILGGQPDAVSANRMLILLCRGRVKPPKNALSCIVKLNDMMDLLELPLTQKVLLERVEVEIGGVHALTREGPTADRDGFVGLVRELVSEVGLLGGPGMCEALIKRARITLSSGENDLTFEQALDSLLDLMPNRAVRLGFLLDLGLSSSGKKETELIKQALDRIVQQLNFLASLVPDASGPEKVKSVVEGLKQRLNSPGIPDDWKVSLAGELDALVERTQGGSGKTKSKKATKDDTYKLDIGLKDMNGPTGERRSVSAGDIIFEEGEVGDMAYLIISGEVEIFRTSGNRERVLATLDRGEIIGEMSLIDNAPRMASARALSDLELSIISRVSLQNRLDRLEETDRVLRRLIAVLVSRIRGQAQSPE